MELTATHVGNAGTSSSSKVPGLGWGIWIRTLEGYPDNWPYEMGLWLVNLRPLNVPSPPWK